MRASIFRDSFEKTAIFRDRRFFVENSVNTSYNAFIRTVEMGVMGA